MSIQVFKITGSSTTHAPTASHPEVGLLGFRMVNTSSSSALPHHELAPLAWDVYLQDSSITQHVLGAGRLALATTVLEKHY